MKFFPLIFAIAVLCLDETINARFTGFEFDNIGWPFPCYSASEEMFSVTPFLLNLAVWAAVAWIQPTKSCRFHFSMRSLLVACVSVAVLFAWMDRLLVDLLARVNEDHYSLLFRQLAAAYVSGIFGMGVAEKAVKTNVTLTGTSKKTISALIVAASLAWLNCMSMVHSGLSDRELVSGMSWSEVGWPFLFHSWEFDEGTNWLLLFFDLAFCSVVILRVAISSSLGVLGNQLFYALPAAFSFCLFFPFVDTPYFDDHVGNQVHGLRWILNRFVLTTTVYAVHVVVVAIGIVTLDLLRKKKHTTPIRPNSDGAGVGE